MNHDQIRLSSPRAFFMVISAMRHRPVAQASSPASSRTVSVRGSATGSTSYKHSGGETPPALAAARAGLPAPQNPISLVSGFHFRGVLPHLKKQGGTYFVTFREAGTLPKEIVLRFKQERDAILKQAMAAKRPLTWHEQEDLFRWYSNRVDKYLDGGHGACHLGSARFAEILAGALCYFAAERYELSSWVVMPNHAHVVVWPMPGHTLSAILHSWKSYTAHEINKRLPQKIVPFWQSEAYEHLIRDDEDLYRCCHYTLMNPVNAGLCACPEDWKWSSAYVAQASSPASSRTVPVRRSATGSTSHKHSGGETPELAATAQPVAQASSPASSRTVPVRGSATGSTSYKHSGGETPPALAGEDACAT